MFGAWWVFGAGKCLFLVHVLFCLPSFVHCNYSRPSDITPVSAFASERSNLPRHFLPTIAQERTCLLIRSSMRTSSAHPPLPPKPPSRMICGFAPINPSVFIKDLHSSCKNPASEVRIIDKMSGFCRSAFSVFVRFIARFEVCCRIGLRVRINKR